MSIISAGTSVGTSLVSTGDTTGNLVFKTGSSNTTALTISGTDQSATFAGAVSFSSNAFAAGSASAPSITFTGDTNTGIFSPGADTIAFTEGGTESMRITSAGNLGIGTTSPATKLDFGPVSNNTQIISVRQNGNNRAGLGINSDFGLRVTGPSDASATISFGSISVSDGSTFTERLRIASAGEIGIGGANDGTSGQVLTSGGSGAAPSWQTVSGGVTSLNGQTGAITNTAFNAIGSYILGVPINSESNFSYNNTYSSSNIGKASITAVSNGCNFFISAGSGNNTGMSGTWRAMGQANNQNYSFTLMVRIS